MSVTTTDRPIYAAYLAKIDEQERAATIRNLSDNANAIDAMFAAKEAFLTVASDALAAYMVALAEYNLTRGVSLRGAQDDACAQVESHPEDDWLQLVRAAFDKTGFS